MEAVTAIRAPQLNPAAPVDAPAAEKPGAQRAGESSHRLRFNSKVVLSVLSLLSFLIYSISVLYQGQYLVAQCRAECGAALIAAVSYSVYGDPLGTIDSNVEKAFGGTPTGSIERTSHGDIPRGKTHIAFDDIGIGYIIFASMALKIFGPHMVSLPAAFLTILAISVIAFTTRFRDDRLFAVPLVFFALTVMLLTWQNTDRHAIDHGFIGGIRYMAILAILPIIHILFEILDRDQADRALSANTLLLAVQAGVFAFAIIVRGSPSYGLIGAAVAAGVVLWRARTSRVARRRIARIVVCGAIVSGGVIGAMVASVPADYVKTGRITGNVWHRVFESLSMHAAWPYGRLEEMFPCPRDKFPGGIAWPRWDPVAWCAWWAAKPQSEIEEEPGPPERYQLEYYDRTYERVMRADFFRVLSLYPKEVFETFYWDKSLFLLATIRDALTISWADVPHGIFPLFLMQCIVFLAFVTVNALSSPLRPSVFFPIFSGLLGLAIIPGYIAYHTLDGNPDLIAFMYMNFALCLAQVLQAQVLQPATLFAENRSRISLSTTVAASAVVSFLALIYAINFYDFGEINHPLITPHPWPRPSPTVGAKNPAATPAQLRNRRTPRGVTAAAADAGGEIHVLSATYGGNCGAAAGNATSDAQMSRDGERKCAYTPSVKRLGDPASRCGKALMLEYRCAPGGPVINADIEGEAGLGKSVELSCQPNGVKEEPPGRADWSGIRVLSATYGGNCGAPFGNATGAIEKACGAQKSCDYTVDVNKLGDPAQGCENSFFVKYRCGGETAPRTHRCRPWEFGPPVMPLEWYDNGNGANRS